MIMPLSVKNQSIETSGITKDYREAICEYIWNGFEANATEIKIDYTVNELTGIETIVISDNGNGISYEELSDTFGAFLASQKNTLSLQWKSKANKGKGRFSFIAFATEAVWHTRYKHANKIEQYAITLTNSNKEVFECTEPQTATINETGTTVTFYNIFDITKDSLSNETLEDYLLSQFAWYLYLNKNKKVKLILNNIELDYNKHIDSTFSEEADVEINGVNFNINLVVWNEKIKEKFCCYYFDQNNVIKGTDTTTYNRNTVNFNHSVFVKSGFFNCANNISLSNQIELGQSEENYRILKELNKIIQELIATKLKAYMSDKADKEIEKMIKEKKTFPSFSNDVYGQLRKNDLMKVTKELYCLEPKIFYKLKEVQEKSLLGFLNLLLNSEERENVLSIIEQIVELTYEQRKNLAEMLQKTRLENIVETISFIENRYKVIEILKTLVYDFEKFTTERNHIQKIIEQHYWLFGEQYHLASADQTMQKALEQYLYILYGAKKSTDDLEENDELARRMDIFLCSARQVENSFGSFIEENIVIELKAPKVPLTKSVLRQIEDYMDFIRKQPQVSSIHRRWKFIAVCKEVNEDVKAHYKTFEDKGKPGLVLQVKNYEVYALTWDDIFKGFDLRHSFMLDKLKFDRETLSQELMANQNEQNRETANNLTKTALAL